MPGYSIIPDAGDPDANSQSVNAAGLEVDSSFTESPAGDRNSGLYLTPYTEFRIRNVWGSTGPGPVFSDVGGQIPVSVIDPITLPLQYVDLFYSTGGWLIGYVMAGTYLGSNVWDNCTDQEFTIVYGITPGTYTVDWVCVDVSNPVPIASQGFTFIINGVSYGSFGNGSGTITGIALSGYSATITLSVTGIGTSPVTTPAGEYSVHLVRTGP